MTEEALFELVAGVSEVQRKAILDRECAGDPALRSRVEALLSADANPDLTIDQPRGISESSHASVGTVGSLIAGKYKLIEAIGEGGMGSVWLAQQTEPVKRKVAVKLIKAGMDSKAVLARFDAERQALAMMDHPNIAKVLDGGLHDGRPFFVMELVKGVPITEYCDARKLTPKERLELFVPVCQAIQHAHQKGIIHRDIKPSNVLVALYDDKPVPKVIDFGLAKATGASLTDLSMNTAFGGVVGTPQYMSPEQASLNNLDIDTRSDVYSLGILLYELLAGNPPFRKQELEKAGMLEILRMVREEEPPKPSTKLSSSEALPSLSANRGTEPKKLTALLRSELDWIVLKALEKDRTRRYETANGFAADVQRYLSGEAVQAHPPSTVYRLRKFVRRHKGQAVAAALIAGTMILGLVTSLWQANRANHETARTMAALNELRDTAPAFYDQARTLAAVERFNEALDKAEYATKLRPDVPEYLVYQGDLLQCQFRFAEAQARYQAALALKPYDDRIKASIALSLEMQSAPQAVDGKLTRESLGTLLVGMQKQQRPAAELMPVSRLLGEEKKILIAYWLERLKVLPISPEKPLATRLTIREDGLLTLDLSSTKVADLSSLSGAPVAVLNLSNSGEISDLAPLQGIKLIELDITGTKVADLSPLANMRSLNRFKASYAPINNISPLQGHPLIMVNIDDCTAVNDLSALRGAPIQELSIRATRVADLTPLIGMPLKTLDMVNVPVNDFTPLKNLPLELVNFAGCKLTDLNVLRGMPVKELLLWQCGSARNYTVLNEMPTLELLILPGDFRSLPEEDFDAILKLRTHPKLRQLGCANTSDVGYDHSTTRSAKEFWKQYDEEQMMFAELVQAKLHYKANKLTDGTYRLDLERQPFSNLNLFKGKPVSELFLPETQVADLKPLQGMQIKALHLFATPVTDLSPLKGMPLTFICLVSTKVTDISQLKDSPLNTVKLNDCQLLTDITPLRDMKTLRWITLPPNVKDFEFLRQMPNVERISWNEDSKNGYRPSRTAQEFWKEYDNEVVIQKAIVQLGITATELKRYDDGRIEIDFSKIKNPDLKVIRDLPIQQLNLGGCKINDLSPLQGMPLHGLWIYQTNVTDLSPLTRMPLKHLNIGSTLVRDISPLKDMDLTILRMTNCTEITDVSALKDMKNLIELTLPTNAKNFAFLRTLPKLERLSYKEDPNNSYRPSQTVAEFWKEYDAGNYDFVDWAKYGINPNTVKRAGDGSWELFLTSAKNVDLAKIRNAPIKHLRLGYSDVADLAPLQGMQLKGLYIYGTKVTDLSPIKGMPLEILNMGSTKVRDLSPIHGMKLTLLRLNDCPEITDVSALKGMTTLHDLILPENVKEFEFLRNFKDIQRLSFVPDTSKGYRPDKTAAEFWRDYDAKK